MGYWGAGPLQNDGVGDWLLTTIKWDNEDDIGFSSAKIAAKAKSGRYKKSKIKKALGGWREPNSVWSDHLCGAAFLLQHDPKASKANIRTAINALEKYIIKGNLAGKWKASVRRQITALTRKITRKKTRKKAKKKRRTPQKRRVCKTRGCKTTIRAKKGPGRPREYCSQCR